MILIYFHNTILGSKNITWVEAETLTTESLQRICDEVLEQIRKNELTGFIKEYKYVPVNATQLQTLRVIKGAAFYSFLEAEQQELTVAVCVYDKIKFFLTRADDNNVFRLWQDSAGFFSLKSGLHPVHFK